MSSRVLYENCMEITLQPSNPNVDLTTQDLQEDYRFNTKRGFLRYILQSDIERKRLQLELEPPQFPIITIKAPVPWKCSVQVAKNRLEEVLMVNHPVLQAIQILWRNLYHDLLIVDTAKFYKGDIPYHAENITELINSCCKITRDVNFLFINFLFLSCVTAFETLPSSRLVRANGPIWMKATTSNLKFIRTFFKQRFFPVDAIKGRIIQSSVCFR